MRVTNHPMKCYKDCVLESPEYHHAVYWAHQVLIASNSVFAALMQPSFHANVKQSR